MIGERSPEVKIFVLQHAPCELPSCYSDRGVYVPIQCGRALHDPIPGTIGDDVGDNISKLNVRYNEMTAMYWVIRHYDVIGNPEFVGFDHYRRFLNWDGSWLRPGCVVARKWFSWRRLWNQYVNCHGEADIVRFSNRFRQSLGLEYSDYDLYWKTHGFYICNMFVMHRDDFRRYGEFIVSCVNLLRELESERPFSQNGRSCRIPGFILETMTSFWIWHERRAGRIEVKLSKITHFPIANEVNGGGMLNKKSFLWFLRQAY